MSRIVLQTMRSQHYYFRRAKAAAFVWRHMIAALYLFPYIFGRNRLHLEDLEYVKWGHDGKSETLMFSLIIPTHSRA